MSFSLNPLRRSVAEVLASAVRDIFPEAQLVGGGINDVGFYYDFAISQPIDHHVLRQIEERMYGIIKDARPIEILEMVRKNAVELLLYHHHPFRADFTASMKEEIVPVFKMGDFYDSCSSPYLENRKEITALRLTQATSLTRFLPSGEEIEVVRIHGTVFPDKSSLKKFLKRAESAKKRNHQKLGHEMRLFEMHEKMSPGSAFWLARGTVIRRVLLDWWYEAHHMANIVSTPGIIRSSQAPSFTVENQEYAPRCSLFNAHYGLFQSSKKLPVSYAECAEFYEDCPSEQLDGLFRTRTYTTDRIHIFCADDEVKKECISSLQFIKEAVTILGFECRWVYHKHHQDKMDDVFTEALKTCGIDYLLGEEPSSYRGSRVNVLLVDALGRCWKGPFVEVSQTNSKQLGLHYQIADATMHKQLVISRSMFGSLERCIATLLEYYAGDLPFWLVPEQVRVIPVAERHRDYSEKVSNRIVESGFRTGIEGLGKNLAERVHKAEQERVPYIAIVGDKEEKNGTVTIRKDQAQTLDGFVEQLTRRGNKRV